MILLTSNSHKIVNRHVMPQGRYSRTVGMFIISLLTTEPSRRHSNNLLNYRYVPKAYIRTYSYKTYLQGNPKK